MNVSGSESQNKALRIGLHVSLRLWLFSDCEMTSNNPEIFKILLTPQIESVEFKYLQNPVVSATARIPN